MKEKGINSILGNVEQQIVQDQSDCGCNFKEGSLCDTLQINGTNLQKTKLIQMIKNI